MCLWPRTLWPVHYRQSCSSAGRCMQRRDTEIPIEVWMKISFKICFKVKDRIYQFHEFNDRQSVLVHCPLVYRQRGHGYIYIILSLNHLRDHLGTEPLRSRSNWDWPVVVGIPREKARGENSIFVFHKAAEEEEQLRGCLATPQSSVVAQPRSVHRPDTWDLTEAAQILCSPFACGWSIYIRLGLYIIS